MAGSTPRPGSPCSTSRRAIRPPAAWTAWAHGSRWDWSRRSCLSKPPRSTGTAGRVAALNHTSIDGREDVQTAENVRFYVMGSFPHGGGGFPPTLTWDQPTAGEPHRGAHRQARHPGWAGPLGPRGRRGPAQPPPDPRCRHSGASGRHRGSQRFRAYSGRTTCPAATAATSPVS